MRTWLQNAWSTCGSLVSASLAKLGALSLTALVSASGSLAQSHEAGGEANLKLPDLSSVSFLGVNGHKLLLFGLVICFLGLLFGLVIYSRLKNLPVHKSMKDISIGCK